MKPIQDRLQALYLRQGRDKTGKQLTPDQFDEYVKKGFCKRAAEYGLDKDYIDHLIGTVDLK